MVKSTVYTQSRYLGAPNLGPLFSMTNRFRDTILSKIGNAQNGLKHLNVKRTLYTLGTYPSDQNFARCRSFRNTRLSETEI